MIQKNNTEREISYIFLWLVGIIFIYAVIQSYFLEPTKKEIKQHIAMNEHISTEKSLTPLAIKATTEKNTAHTVDKPIESTVETKKLEAVSSLNNQNNSIENSTETTASEKEIVTDTIKKNPTVETVKEETKTIEAIPNKEKSHSTVKDVNENTKTLEKLKKELSIDEQRAEVETERQRIIEQAEASRNEALKALNR